MRLHSSKVCGESIASVLWLTSALPVALTALRNQLTIKPTEDHVAADDERLLLVKSWLDTDPGANDIFELWERTNTVRSTLFCVYASAS